MMTLLAILIEFQSVMDRQTYRQTHGKSIYKVA